MGLRRQPIKARRLGVAARSKMAERQRLFCKITEQDLFVGDLRVEEGLGIDRSEHLEARPRDLEVAAFERPGRLYPAQCQRPGLERNRLLQRFLDQFAAPNLQPDQRERR